MANKWIDYVYQETDYRGSDLAIAQKLADAANRDTDKCRIKIETLSKQTRLSSRQVKRVLAHLEGDGFLKIQRYRGRGLQSEFQLKKVTSATPFKDRKKVTQNGQKGDIHDTQKGDKKVTSATVKGDICDIKKVTSATPPIYEPFKEPFMNPEEGEPRTLELGNGLIPDTEEILGFSLDNYTRELIEVTVTDFLPEWLQILKNRMVGFQNHHPNFVKTRIGYWIEDYSKNLWRFKKDREANNGTNQQTLREKRQSDAIADRNIVDAARQRIAERKLSGSDVGDSGGQLRTLVPKSDDGRKALTG